MGVCLHKKEGYLLLHEVTNIVPYPPKIIEVKTHLITTKVKLPVVSRVNQANLECIYMAEKYACSRGVIHSLTSNANVEG